MWVLYRVSIKSEDAGRQTWGFVDSRPYVGIEAEGGFNQDSKIFVGVYDRYSVAIKVIIRQSASVVPGYRTSLEYENNTFASVEIQAPGIGNTTEFI